MQIKTEAGETIEVDLDQYTDDVKTHFEGKGILLKPKSELDSEINALKLETAEASKKAHLDWEAALGTAVGESKPEGVKGIDWAKGKVKELSEKANKKPEAPLPGSNVEVDTLKKQLEENKKELDTFKASLEKEKEEGKNSAKKTALKSSIKALKLVGDTPEEKAEAISGLEAIIGSKYRTEFDAEGDLVLYQGNDILTDPEAGNAPMKIDKLVKTKFKHFLVAEVETPKPVGGTGTKQEDVLKKTADGKEGVVAKSREEIQQKAMSLGYPFGSAKYIEFRNASLKLSGLE